MGFSDWLASHIVSIIQSVGVIGGLIYTARSFRMDVKARRVSNLLAITKHHHDIWSELYVRPELARVLQAGADPNLEPITHAEELFISLLILHLFSSYRAIEKRELNQPQGLARDIRAFFGLPLPRAVWNRLRDFQDADFAGYVDSLIRQD